MKKLLTLLAVVASSLISVSSSSAVNIVPGFNSSSLAANDDGSTGLVNIGFSANFFGTTYTQLYANNNGNLTFDAPLSTFTPFNLFTAGRVIIAPFFADVDTRNPASNLLRYGTGTYGGNLAFGATWNGVGYFPSAADKLNEFQVILEDRSDVAAGDFDIHFFYDQIQWETGGASGGSGGLGGNSARVGYSNGTAANSFEFAGSAVNGAFLDGGPNSLVSNSNVGTAGQYLFQVRSGVVAPPNPSVPDGGTTLALFGGGLAAIAAFRRKFAV